MEMSHRTCRSFELIGNLSKQESNVCMLGYIYKKKLISFPDPDPQYVFCLRPPILRI